MGGRGKQGRTLSGNGQEISRPTAHVTLCLATAAEGCERGPDAAQQTGIAVNESAVIGAPRKGLDSQCSATGEQVEAVGTGNIRLQPVEKRLSDPVRRGSQAPRIDNRQSTPAPRPPIIRTAPPVRVCGARCLRPAVISSLFVAVVG